MRRNIVMWALMCATALAMSSQQVAVKNNSSVYYAENDSIDADSVLFDQLDEVIVTALPVIKKVDRKIVLPDQERVRTSTDGLDLLRKMQLPRISVNQLTGAVTLAGGGEVKLCINGAQAEECDIAALMPGDIVRIEYHDNPGARYGDADAVVDYITRHLDCGGNLMVDSFDALRPGKWASIDHISGQYNRGASVWSVNAGYMGQRKNGWMRDYEETWRYPDHEVTRREVGMPVRVGGDDLQTHLNYTLYLQDDDMLNVRLGTDYSDVPGKEEGDRHALLYTSYDASPLSVVEHMSERSMLPSLNIYYRHKIASGRQLTFDVTGTYMHSNTLHSYSESSGGDLLSEMISKVRGDRYTISGEGVYEVKSGALRLTAGMRNSFVSARNCYNDGNITDVDVAQNVASAYGEYVNQFGAWSVMGNLTLSYLHSQQDDVHLGKVSLAPSASVSYIPADGWYLRYRTNMTTKLPPIAAMSAVEQVVQSGMVRRGNPALKTSAEICQQFACGYDCGWFGADVMLDYSDELRPVMESAVYEDGLFVRYYDNQRSFQRLLARTSLNVRPWREHLSIMLSPVIDRYISHGNAYSHCHTMFRLGLGLDFTYGNFMFYANTMSGPANSMYGEEIIEEKDMNMIMAGYKREKWSVSAGVFNAFMKEYWMESRNLSLLTPYTSKGHSRSNSYLTLKFSLTLDFGHQRNPIDIPEADVNSDSGIMNGLK